MEQALGRVLETLASVGPGSRTVLDRYNAYVRWAIDAARILRNQIRPADIERLVLTRRYWLLQSLLGNVVGPVGDLVESELDERQMEIQEARQTLRSWIERWSRPGRFVVLDTNVYIEHPDKLEDIDFAELISVRAEPVHVLVPIIIIDELDNLKRSSNKKTRWRAPYTLAVIDRVLPAPTVPGKLRAEDFSALNSGGIPRGAVTVEIVFDPPGHIRLPLADDEIIDRAQAISALAGRPVALVTYDTGQSTRARAAGLDVVKLNRVDEKPS